MSYFILNGQSGTKPHRQRHTHTHMRWPHRGDRERHSLLLCAAMYFGICVSKWE